MQVAANGMQTGETGEKGEKGKISGMGRRFERIKYKEPDAFFARLAFPARLAFRAHLASDSLNIIVLN